MPIDRSLFLPLSKSFTSSFEKLNDIGRADFSLSSSYGRSTYTTGYNSSIIDNVDIMKSRYDTPRSSYGRSFAWTRTSSADSPPNKFNSFNSRLRKENDLNSNSQYSYSPNMKRRNELMSMFNNIYNQNLNFNLGYQQHQQSSSSSSSSSNAQRPKKGLPFYKSNYAKHRSNYSANRSDYAVYRFAY